MPDEKKKIKTTSLLLRKLPPHINKLIIDEQAAMNKDCNCSVSKERAIYSLITKHSEKENETNRI